MTTIHHTSIRSHVLAGLVALAVLFVVGVGWSITTTISGAVISEGILVVKSGVKVVQHPTGGVIGAILVDDGAAVQSGDVLIRLDETVTKANLAIVLNTLDQLNAKKARLQAERDDLDRFSFPSDMAERASNPDVASLMTGERRLFDLRKSARAGQKSQLQERIKQLNDQIGGLVGQIVSNTHQKEFIGTELTGVRDLWEKRLVPIQRVMSLEREAARLDGEINRLAAAIAEAKGKIAETKLQISQIDQNFRSDVAKELHETDAKLSEMEERKVAAADQLSRIEIRSPQNGIVNQLAVRTVGGVITPGETLMSIVPDSDALEVEVKFSPVEVDQVKVGQTVSLRFSAFNQRTTPEIMGEVTRVSSDVAHDAKTSAIYYVARIIPNKTSLKQIDGFQFVPGMPVEAFIQTDPRTVASYLVKPLYEQFQKAFRER